MICITLAQESRTLVLADMLNAHAMGADLIEVRLDTFENAPVLSEILQAKRTPLLFSCRRVEDGGNWQGSEEDRLMMLRQAVLSKADYVEIELDVADQIRPFPGCQRVITYTNLRETPADIADIYAEMQTKKPDVIKLVCKARTPEEAWPLVQILNKPALPTVVVGLGRPGIMLSVLGRKIGAPWTSAAIERGAEAYPGQPTIRELQEVYRYVDIGKPTRFFGVTGLGDQPFLASLMFNTAFVEMKQSHRVLPMQVGNSKTFRKIIDAVRIQGIALDKENYESSFEIGSFDETSRTPVQAADYLHPVEGGWRASNTYGQAVANALEAHFKQRDPSLETPLKGRLVAFVGCGPLTRMVAAAIKSKGCSVIFASKDRDLAQRLGQTFGGRQIALEALYQTIHEILIVSSDGNASDAETDDDGEAPLPFHPGYLKHNMTMLDLNAEMMPTRIMKEARSRSTKLVHPGEVLLQQVIVQLERLLPNQEIPKEKLRAKLIEWLPEEEHEGE
jgi:3-dehydroquinate dehydratase / shikimate dehydrogenase